MLLFALMSVSSVLQLSAQSPVEGTTYYLPRTELQFTFLVEKTTYTPGEFAIYAQRYMKRSDVKKEAETAYRIVDVKMQPIAVPDSSKRYTLLIDKKYTISDVARKDNGILLGINVEPMEEPQPQAPFAPAPKPKQVNPKDYLNEDILTAGSPWKMAELTAQEIYEIRESRNLLSRGKAEFMPQDGAQLRMMLDGMDRQERALLQLFEGTTLQDTTEVRLVYVPKPGNDRDLFFRFSRHFGFVDNDDLGGSPYYITVTEEQIPTADENLGDDKKIKDDINLYVNIPGRVKVSLLNGAAPIFTNSLFMGQYGVTENLSGALFGKKQTSKVQLNPITGGIERITEEVLGK
ncbi:MAG: DUF4831 family protein [Prevotella sp.]|nr:DUF4831 family protein [Prevotella sp.]